MGKRTLGGIGTPSANYGRENLHEVLFSTPIESLPVQAENDLDRKLIDIIQNSGSLRNELDRIKTAIKTEVISAFNQGCINGNGAAREAYKGEVISLSEYLSKKGL